MEMLFLIALLAAVVYMNRGMFGFGKKCDWMRADQNNEDGSVKWMCTTCGATQTTDGTTPPPCDKA